jgi:hypothetical protein
MLQIFFVMSKGRSVRYSLYAIALLTLALGCKSKPKLTTDDAQYIRTTIALMRVRVQLQPSDSITVNQKLDSVYRALGTSKQNYTRATEQLGTDEKHAALVYQTIKDSLGIK